MEESLIGDRASAQVGGAGGPIGRVEYWVMLSLLISLGVADTVLCTVNLYYYTDTYAQFFNQVRGNLRRRALAPAPLRAPPCGPPPSVPRLVAPLPVPNAAAPPPVARSPVPAARTRAPALSTSSSPSRSCSTAGAGAVWPRRRQPAASRRSSSSAALQAAAAAAAAVTAGPRRRCGCWSASAA